MGSIRRGRNYRHPWATQPILRCFTALLFLMAIGCNSSTRPSGGDTTSDGRATLEKTDADILGADIVSSDPSVRGQVVSSNISEQTEISASPLLPSGSTVAIDISTFNTAAFGLASVEATVVGSSPGRWLLYIVKEQGEWKLLGTKRLS